jgi:hypothetical protein
MNISLANLESFQEAIKQATKLIKVPDPNERIELADRMRKGATYDFFQLETDDENEEDKSAPTTNDNSMPFYFLRPILKEYIYIYIYGILFLDSAVPTPSVQNNQQFMQTMMTQGKKKRLLDDDGNVSTMKKYRINIKTEPEQVRVVSIKHTPRFNMLLILVWKYF